MPKILEMRNISKIYGEKTTNPTQVLFDLDLSFEKGTFNSIIGQSGSGKSTLLNIMGTLDKASFGTVLINGRQIDQMSKSEISKLRNESIGFIFQFHYLLPEYTALENVLLPYRISNQKVTKEIIKKANELLDIVGLTDRKNNLASNLSGGQQQRVAIARSLINEPSIILADEPTGNLDSDLTEQVYELLRKINQKYKTTFIVITHDRHIAEKADRIIELKDGRIHLDIHKKK